MNRPFAERGFIPSGRSAEHGFTSLGRSAEHGFTSLGRSAEHGFTSLGRSAEHGFTSLGRSAEHGFTSLGRSAEHGFTLVEVMIALMIFGMIAAAGVALLSFSVRAQAATGARLDEVTAIARLSSALSADLAQAVDRPARDGDGTLRPAFVGEASAMQLTRGGWSNLDNAARPTLQKVAWRLNGGVIERQGWPMLDGAAPLSPAAMLDRVRSIALRYRVDGAWLDHWQGAPDAALPQAVELRIVRDDGVAIRELFYVRAEYRRTEAAAGA